MGFFRTCRTRTLLAGANDGEIYPADCFNLLTMPLPVISTEQEFRGHYQSEIWLEAGRQICQRHGIAYLELRRSEPCEHIVLFVDDAFVIKIFAPFRRGFAREKAALEFANGKTSLRTPEIVSSGDFEGFDYLIQTRIAGELMTRQRWLTLPEKEQVAVLTQLAVGLRELHSYNADSPQFHWHDFIERQSKTAVESQLAAGVNPEWVERLPGYIGTNQSLLPEDLTPVFLHGDVHFGNLRLLRSGGRWRISGLFDFADSLCGFHEYDFVAIGVLMIQGQGGLQREFFEAYGYGGNELDLSFRKRLMLLTVLYECSDLRRYAMRLMPEAVNFPFEKLEEAIWSFIA
jgi:hygromycin-B 7''-O-kinase